MSTATFVTTRLKPTHDAAGDLCRHLKQCHVARGRWFGVAMLGEEIRLVAPRFATTVMLGAIVIVTACVFL